MPPRLWLDYLSLKDALLGGEHTPRSISANGTTLFGGVRRSMTETSPEEPPSCRNSLLPGGSPTGWSDDAFLEAPPSRYLKPLTARQQRIVALSERLTELQRPLRILDAVAWPDAVRRDFLQHDGRQLPAISAESYPPLAFDPERRRDEFLQLESAIRQELGSRSPMGQLLLRSSQHYRQAIELLRARGTGKFYRISKHLFGSSLRQPDGSDPLADLTVALHQWADELQQAEADAVPSLDSHQAARELNRRLAQYFGPLSPIRVKLADRLSADAAAGTDYLKIRRDARFSPLDIRLLEVHEGWVHLGTTLNGRSQRLLGCLSKASPAATATQEGLAVLTEFLADVQHSRRLRRLALRFAGLRRAEQGADFCEVYRFFRESGASMDEAYQQSQRIFRGSLPARCGPFTKDVCYGLGLVQTFHAIRQATQHHDSQQLEAIFCGKLSLTDLPQAQVLLAEGGLSKPRHLPPPFRDSHHLAERLRQIGSRLRLSAIR